MIVVTDSSTAMHAAAAFRKRAIVVLGAVYDDALNHKRQWGYDEQIILGTNMSTGKLPSPR
jgi:heptosyltransferase-2